MAYNEEFSIPNTSDPVCVRAGCRTFSASRRIFESFATSPAESIFVRAMLQARV